MSTSRGTALVLALVLLTALLLLGLPFLFSQSSSMAGTRSFAGAQLAEISQANAHNLGIDAAATVVAPSLAAPQPGAVNGWRAWSNLPASAAAMPGTSPLAAGSGIILLGSAPELGSGAIAVSPTLMQHLGVASSADRWGDTQLSVTIADESGKLDPNALSAPAWQALLTAVGITDWNDQLVYRNPGMPPPGGFPPGTYIPSADALGQLAKALAGLARWLPQGRIVVLEQLLQADPQHPGGPGTTRFERLRWPLTRVELERLRPQLTLHALPPGRGGLIDLGTVLQVDPSSQAVLLDSQPDPLQPILGIGSRVLSQVPAGTRPTGHAGVSVIAMPLPGLQWGDGSLSGYPYGVVQGPAAGTPWAAPGQTLMLSTPAPLNLHQLTPAVRLALAGGAQPLPVPTDGRQLLVVPTIGGLWQVSGRGWPAQTISLTSLAGWTDPVHAGVELPPLGITTQGVMAITAQAVVTDALGREIATAGGTTWAQVLPQEQLLERHWLTQGDWHGLVAGRWGSRVQAWPTGYERTTDLAPDDHDFSAGAVLGDIPPSTGIRPRPLENEALAYVMSDIIAKPATTVLMPEMYWPLELRPFDWRVGFGMGWPVASSHLADAETFLSQGRWRSPAGLAPANPGSCIRPDGFYHAPATRLSYPLFSSLSATIGQSALLLPRDSTQELAARHVGLWVRPEADWSSGIHPLLSVRMPLEDAGVRVDGSTGDPGSENVFSLAVDADRGLLVLALAPPAVESIGDAGMPIDAWNGTDPTLDHQCLSETPAGALAPDPYTDHADPAVASSMAAFSTLFSRNRVLHCYATPTRNGQPFFRAGQWYRIDVAMASDRPDGVALLVDGMVGQDAAHLPGGPRLSTPGDHCTLPGLVLVQALPGGLVTSAAQLSLASIPVAAPAPLNARSVLPAQGVVRIDDEYIRYAGISADGSTLLGCWRGCRQSTAATSAVPSQVYPNLQPHAAGALVSPGGYRILLGATAPAGACLYRGGCTLSQALGTGDPTPAQGHLGAIWVPAGAGAAAGTGSTPAPVQVGGSLPVSPTAGVWDQFPATGIVLVGSTALVYGAKGATSLEHLEPVVGGTTTWTLAPPGALPMGGWPAGGLTWHVGDPILLVGMPVRGVDPTEPGRYVQAIRAPSTERMVSLQDAAGSCEWMAYDGFASAGAGRAFLINRAAFADGQRHRSRTPLLSHLAGTQVVPVQTELTGCGHWMMTGDAITLLPRAAATGAPPPGPAVQVLVRYAATDGWGADPGANVDCNNDDVAFSGPIPAAAVDASPGAGQALLATDWEIVSGNGWSGQDLSPSLLPNGAWAGSSQPRGLLPRLDLWSHQRGANGIDAQVVIAADDPSTPQPASSDCTVDDLVAGGLTTSGGGLDGHELLGTVPDPVIAGISGFWVAGQPTTQLAAADTLAAGVLVEATTPIFSSSGFGMGLVDIDGEVFAYEQPYLQDAQELATALQTFTPTLNATQVLTGGHFARLVARGLLCDAGGGLSHLMGTGNPADDPVLPTGQRRGALLAAIRLPMGPVRMLDGDVGAAWWGLVASDAPGAGSAGWLPLGAPLGLICSPDGLRRELVEPIGPRQAMRPAVAVAPGPGNALTTAPWLRGLYNSPGPAIGASGWTGTAGAVRPVVIGWWPRYASACAGSASPPSEQVHGRSFPWIGCPVAVAGGYFDEGLRARLGAPWSSLPMVSIVADSDPAVRIEARAGAQAPQWGQSAPAMSWSLQTPLVLPTLGLDPTDASELFTPAADGGRTFSTATRVVAADGIEVRLTWRYTQAASQLFEDLAAAGGRAPTLHSVRIRYLAPVRVLGSEQR